MTSGSFALVVHPPLAPGTAERRALDTLVAALSHAPAQVLEVDGDRSAPAAARLNTAIAHASSAFVLVVSATAPPGAEALSALLDAAQRRTGLLLAAEDDVLAPWLAPVRTDDFAALLAATASDVFDRGAPINLLPNVPAFVVERDTFLRLGGFDARLGGVGEVIDLALRALDAGIGVDTIGLQRSLDATGTALSNGDKREALSANARHSPLATRHDTGLPVGADPTSAIRLKPDPTKELLMWRNAAWLALSRPDPDVAGALLGHVATLAIATAWRASGLHETPLPFGGDWARESPLDRLLGRAGVPRNATFWPRDEVGSLLPILGLDAAMDMLLAAPQGAARLSVGSGQWTVDSQRKAVDSGQWAVDSEPSDVAHIEDRRALVTPQGRARTPPLVSVIVVNWNGAEHLEACFTSLLASRYPGERLELICVDNGSRDGSRALMRARFPNVRLVELEQNLGFAGGNNAGIAVARGEVLAFFNNDMRVEPDAIPRLIEAIDDEQPCTAARVLSWDGRRIDFVRGTISFEARGFQDHYGERVRPELSAAGESFFPNGGAFAITREAYARAGGFDDRFFSYYEDVDLGWGLQVAGRRVRVVPEAIVYHKHGATSSRQPRGQKRFLMERNAVWAAMKRYDDGSLRRVLGAMLTLAARRIAQDCSLERGSPVAKAIAPHMPRLGGSNPAVVGGSAEDNPAKAGSARQIVEPGAALDNPAEAGSHEGVRFVRRFPVESLAALGEAVRAFPCVTADRRRLQAARRMDDRRVLPRFGRALEALSSRTSYRRAHDTLVERLRLEEMFRQQTRVLVVTHEPLRPNMSGPGVRALEIGRALSAGCRVTVATPYPPELRDDRCRIAQYSFADQRSMRLLAEDADVIVVQGFTLARYPFLSRLPASIVVDLYCPFTIEHLEMKTSALAAQAPAASSIEDTLAEAAPVLAAQNEQLGVGDFFLCASERQRDFWLGALQTVGRVNARTYAADPTLRSLIDVVPFGVPDAAPPPPATRRVKGAIEGIRQTDRVLLWAGSILDWQDPQTLIRAVAELARRRDDVRLVFMGARHPNPDVPPMRAVQESVDLAQSLGVLDTHVFFNSWVPYVERHEWLLDADLGVSTHRDHLETRLSYRTRMLDYIWSGLPIVCTDGDVFADLVRERGLGRVVPPENVHALVDAIDAMLGDEAFRESCRSALGRVADEMRWSRVVGPLQRFCETPRFAADREPGMRAVRSRLEQKYRVSKWLKRTALDLGVSEGLIERVKHTPPVRAAMVLRNKVAIARARRGQ